MCTNSSGDGGLWFEPSYGNFQTCVVCMCGVCGVCGMCGVWCMYVLDSSRFRHIKQAFTLTVESQDPVTSTLLFQQIAVTELS